MREDLKENIKISLQKFIPFVLSLLMVFCVYIPSYFGISRIIRPDVGMICVFYWVIYRPDLFNMFAVFFLGFASDTISVGPLGSNIIAYLTIYVIVFNISSFFINKPFWVLWYGFSFVLILAELVKWLVVSIFYAEFLPIGRIFFTILFSIAWYPVICFVNNAAREYLMNDEG